MEARQLLSTVSWDGGGDGTLWSDRLDWSGDQLPGATDDVDINIAGNPNVVFGSGSQSIRSLHSAEALALSGGSLQVSGTVQVDNTFTLRGGTLRNATVLPGIGRQGMSVATFGTLDGVTLDTDMTVADGTGLFITNGLVLNGVLTLNNVNNSTALTFYQGVQTLAGTGQVVLTGAQPFGTFRLG